MFKSTIQAFNKIGVWYLISGFVVPIVAVLIVLLFQIEKVLSYILLVDPFIGLAVGFEYILKFHYYTDMLDEICK
jgi:hypothetical protein